MSILLVMTARTVGGAELYVERLVSALANRCRFTVALPDDPEVADLADRLARHAAVRAFPFGHPRHLPAVASAVRRLARDCDVIHLNSNHPCSRLGILMGFALSGLGRPLLCVEHGVSPRSAIRVPASIAWALPTLFRWSRHRAAQIVVGSDENRRSLIDLYGLPSDRIVVVHPGFDPAPFAAPGRGMLRAELGLAADQPVIIVLGRMSPNKGQRYLVQAAPKILARFPAAHFVFAGNPAGMAELEQQIRAAGLVSHFSLLGFRSDVVNLLRSSDVFVLPSLAEGFSLAIVEALAAGLPVVATRVGGAAEAIVEGRNGFLVPPGDADALGEAVLRVLSLEASAREEMRRAALESAQRFSFAATAQKMHAIYQALKAGSA